MVGLERRLARLEARRIRPPGMTERDAAALLDQLGALAARVRSGGDFTDALGASPAQRYCRARLRCDDALAEALLRDALGGRS